MTDAHADLARRALGVNQANLALGHDVFAADGATFVRDRRFPRIYDANYVADITASTPEAIERLLVRVETEFTHCTHRKFHTDFRTPPGFEARLQLDGYRLSQALVMVLEGDLRGTPRPCDIRPADNPASWAAFFALHQMDWNEYAARTGASGDESVGHDMAQTEFHKSPPVRYWLAYDGGEPRGYFSAWTGIDGVGQVESLFVQAEYRHRGIATALIQHCVADARAHGAPADGRQPVVIVADAGDTPKQMYAAMGFRPVVIKREYLKTVG